MQVLKQEEERFAETLENGMKVLEVALTREDRMLDGETVFQLYDTYGFPVDLTADIARERSVRMDYAGFEAAMDRQRERARAASKFQMGAAVEYKGAKTEFHGYDTLAVDDAQVIAIYRDGSAVTSVHAGESAVIVLDRTPFYATSGGQVASVVLDRLSFANGIQFAPQTEQIFMTETRANTLRIYRRSRDDGALTFINGIQVGRGPDNIDIDKNGTIWIATHPKAFNLIAHADRPESLSPSRVVRLRADGTGLQEIYVGTGEEFSAASVAAVYNGEMLLGTIFDAKLLRCRLPDW